MVVILKRNGLDVGGVHGEIGYYLVFAWIGCLFSLWPLFLNGTAKILRITEASYF